MAGRSACVEATFRGLRLRTAALDPREELRALHGTRDPAAARARRGQRPPLGGETTVARRTLCDRAARAPRAKGWDRQSNAASAEKEGPSVAPWGGPGGGRPWLAPGYPSLSVCAPLYRLTRGGAQGWGIVGDFVSRRVASDDAPSRMGPAVQPKRTGSPVDAGAPTGVRSHQERTPVAQTWGGHHESSLGHRPWVVCAAP